MKVLLIHNFYKSIAPSGEDIVFRKESELLKKSGVKVVSYQKNNDNIMSILDMIRAGINILWSRRSYKEISELIDREKPDLAHFHNIWYLISASAYKACKDKGIPIIQTFHNFRVICINGLLYRSGRICEKCLEHENIEGLPFKTDKNKLRILVNSLRYGCYRESRLHSLPLALANYISWRLGIWNRYVDAYICLTEFARQKFIRAGLPAHKIHLKPNFLDNNLNPHYFHRNYAVFLGRITPEKGVNVLIDAMKLIRLQVQQTDGRRPQQIKASQATVNKDMGFSLKIIGDGQLRATYEEETKKIGLAISFEGKMNFDKYVEILKNAMFVVLPSLCYEGFPMVICEAYACGKPIIASRIGALPELILDKETGLLFQPNSARDLAQKIAWMIDNDSECIRMGKRARIEFEEKYYEKKNADKLIKIYHNVLNS